MHFKRVKWQERCTLSLHTAQHICINVTSKRQCLGRWQDETLSYYAKVQLALLFLHASLPTQRAPGARQRCVLMAGLEVLAPNSPVQARG